MMKFELVPVIDAMLHLYNKPRDKQRFDQYLALLQGNSSKDIELPIMGFNPMAKEKTKEKLLALKSLKAEELVVDVIKQIQLPPLPQPNERIFKIVLNLLDDVEGAWTHQSVSDYETKFKINSLVKRNFCVPVFWVSEHFSEEIIIQRTKEYILRTVYVANHYPPQTLAEHLQQEIFVAQYSKQEYPSESLIIPKEVQDFFYTHQNSTDFHFIFNFFYGDEAAERLQFSKYGYIKQITGFHWASKLASQKPI